MKAPLLEQIDHARNVCVEALRSDELLGATEFLAGQRLTVDRCIELLDATAKTQFLAPELVEARNAALSAPGPAAKVGTIERALLLPAALRTIDRIPDLPVDESVKQLFCKEFISYALPPRGTEERFAMLNFTFICMSRIVFLIRFPGGLMHWERSGFPKRWFLKVPPNLLFRTMRFLTLEAGALKPFLVSHLGGTVRRYPFLLEREAQKSFYRLAAAAELQPEVRGIMAGSWLISKEPRRVSPHLEFLARRFLDAGGVYTEIGRANIDDGFMDGDETRKHLYEIGEYRPTLGVVMCTRQQAIAWKRANAGVEQTLDVS
jgi:hypothetical protein